MFPFAVFLWHAGVSGFSLEILGVGTALILHCMVVTCSDNSGELSDAHRIGGAGLAGPKALPTLLWVVSCALNNCFDPQAEG